MVTIDRVSKPGERYRSDFGSIELSKVANAERPLPKKFIGKDGMSVTSEFLDYINPLVGELPTFFELDTRKVEL